MERPTTKLEYGTIREPYAARVKYDPDYWPPYDITITVDANNGETVHYVIHELLHVMFSPLFAGHVDDTLDEVLIVALDHYMHKYVWESKARLAKWSSLVEAKLAESIKNAPPTTLEKLVDRT